MGAGLKRAVAAARIRAKKPRPNTPHIVALLMKADEAGDCNSCRGSSAGAVVRVEIGSLDKGATRVRLCFACIAELRRKLRVVYAHGPSPYDEMGEW